MQHPKAYLWNIVGRFLPAGIHLVTNIVLARFLSPYDFGMIGVLTVFFTLAQVLMDVGLGGALIQKQEITRLDCSTMSVFNVTASIVLYIALFFSANFVADFFNVDGLANVMRVVCLVFVISAWGLVPRSLMAKQLQFKELSMIFVVSSVCAAIVAIVLGVCGVKVYALVAYQLVFALINVLGAYFVTKYHISFRFSKESFRQLFSFGIMTTITSVIDTIYENIMSVLFGKYISVSQAGYLDQAKKMEIAVTQTFTMTINSVSFPILSRLSNDLKKFTIEADSIFNTVTKGLFPLLMVLCVFSKDIIHLLYGDRWLAAAPYFSLLLFAGLFQVMETLNRNFIKSLGEVQKLAKVTLIKRVVGVGLIVVWMIFSIDTMLYAYIISSFIGYVFNMSIYSKIVSQSMGKQLLQAFYALLPCVIIFLLLWTVCQICGNPVAQIVLTMILLVIYYIFVLPFLGVNTRKYLDKILARRK